MAPFLFIACEKPSDGLGFEQVIGGTIEADSIHLPLISYTAPIDSILVALPYSDQIRFGVEDSPTVHRVRTRGTGAITAHRRVDPRGRRAKRQSTGGGDEVGPIDGRLSAIAKAASGFHLEN